MVYYKKYMNSATMMPHLAMLDRRADFAYAKQLTPQFHLIVLNEIAN